jgi:lipid II:glycine glycyltransferase (peptidoglycan interpeptide bridge formation enzyme)
MFVDLNKKYEDIFSDFQTTTRKQIKRAENRYRIEVKIFENDLSVLDDFWQIYNEAMHRVNAVPYLYFTRDYFRSLIKTTRNACFLALFENKPIAAIIALYNSNYIHGHLGGALTAYQHLSPFSLLYAEMIKFGQTKSCRYFHAGGGATNKPDDPVLKFKMNFSDMTGDFFIGRKVHRQDVYNQLVRQWEMKYPEKIKLYSNLLLKYRY